MRKSSGLKRGGGLGWGRVDWWRGERDIHVRESNSLLGGGDEIFM